MPPARRCSSPSPPAHVRVHLLPPRGSPASPATTNNSRRHRSPAADTGSMPSSAETNGATCQQGDISHGAQYTREELGFKKLPESTSTLGCLKRLKSLNLSMVHITEEGLGHFLSKCSALERLVVYGCSGIICLRIPWTLQQLKILHITTCKVIQMIVIDAPNLCTLYFDGGPLVEISVRNSSQLKDVSMWSDYLSAPGMLAYARARLPSITPNVESLTLRSYKENVDTPMLSSKLIHLKNLEIGVLGSSVEAFSPSYDVFSLVSFLDACPVLESFILWVEQDALRYNPAVVGNDEKYTSRKPECRHNSLRQVTIKGFCLAKSLVELTIHILESAPCLERLMLDTTRGCHRSSRFRALRGSGQCLPMTMTALAEAHKAVEFAGRYIAGRVPKGVEFQVIEPCSGCHTGDP